MPRRLPGLTPNLESEGWVGGYAHMNDTFNGNALSGDFSLGLRGWPGVKGMAILGPPFVGPYRVIVA